MSKIFFSALFICVSFSAFAQYGKLIPLRQGDTIHAVLRTPKEVIEKLKADPDKNVKRTGGVIERLEIQLERARDGFITNRIPVISAGTFTANVKWLESQGIVVRYYLDEYFTYYPRRGQVPYRINKAY